MKIYPVASGFNEFGILTRAGFDRCLYSLAHGMGGLLLHLMDDRNNYRFILDSGAFTNRRPDAPRRVAFADYCDVCKRLHRDAKFSKYCDWYATFDDLSSKHRTWAYYKKAKEEGLNPVFVDHAFFDREPHEVRRLHNIYEQSELVALGGLKPSLYKSEPDMLRRWLDERFEWAEKYRTKLHAFALGVNRLLFEFPFHSCDSSTWLSGARFGHILLWDGRSKRSFSIHYRDHPLAPAVRKRFTEMELDYDKYDDRNYWNAKFLYHLERFLTDGQTAGLSRMMGQELL
ncbi:MAG: hypothetical protein ACPL1K_01430, partial [Candidatus Kryptoniota bacterium]